ncbi:MAG: class I SAM-dependent methyltransferase [Deltaproteobacteria bacterium]|nr:class I SAM-dependent methyltransferase [Deltaproteobacteria bacterium]
MLEPLAPAALVAEELPRIAACARGRPVLDLACGRGRNAFALAGAGLRTIGLDRDAATLGELYVRAREAGAQVSRVRADVEAGHALPFASASLGALLVFRFLFRPLASEITRVLAPGGVLVYETFTTAQRELGGGPRRAAFLLKPGELRTLFPQLRTLRAQEGVFAEPQPTALARLVALKP